MLRRDIHFCCQMPHRFIVVGHFISSRFMQMSHLLSHVDGISCLRFWEIITHWTPKSCLDSCHSSVFDERKVLFCDRRNEMNRKMRRKVRRFSCLWSNIEFHCGTGIASQYHWTTTNYRNIWRCAAHSTWIMKNNFFLSLQCIDDGCSAVTDWIISIFVFIRLFQ